MAKNRIEAAEIIIKTTDGGTPLKSLDKKLKKLPKKLKRWKTQTYRSKNKGVTEQSSNSTKTLVNEHRPCKVVLLPRMHKLLLRYLPYPLHINS